MGHWLGSAAGSQRRRATARSRRGVTFLLLGLISLVASVGAPTAAHGATPGLVAAYSFDAGSGSTAADSSANGNDGTINGATWTTAAKFGNALSFNGSSSYVDFGNPTSLRNTGSMTWSAWVYATADPPDDGQIIAKSSGGSGGAGWQLKTSPDTGPETFGVAVSPDGVSHTQRYSTTVRTLNTWYYVAGVYDAAARELHIYVNGQLDDGVLRGTVPASQADPSQNVNVGRRSGGFYFQGRIDEVRVYNRALSQAEIQADMNQPITPSTTDTIAPAVAVTAPAAGAQVQDTTTLTASASDNVGVAGVQFFVDGTAYGAEDTTAPYAVPWDSQLVANGTHSITAQARDAVGNTTLSTAVTLTVANPGVFQDEILGTQFTMPTSFAFLPDGRMLVGEIGGTIRVLSPPYTQPDPTPLLTISNIAPTTTTGTNEGLMNIAVDPNFAVNHYFYVDYTAGNPFRTRLSRFTANALATGTVPGSELVLYQDPGDAGIDHHGGAILFPNDGTILFTTGDEVSTPGDAQLLTSPRGKVHRINKDGTVPVDNPYYDGSGPNVNSIWAVGLRNPFRGYYDAPTGRTFIGDVGGNVYTTATEHLDLGAPGANYAWPNCESNCPSPPYTNGIFNYAHNGRDACIVAGFVYHGTQFPSSYEGSFFLADYAQNWIKRLTLDANGNVANVFNFQPPDGRPDGPYGSIVDLKEGPDGALYYLDIGFDDNTHSLGTPKLRRIRYVQTNLPPVANSSADVASGPPPLTVNFSSGGSSDPEGQPLSYNWTFGDGTTSTEANPSHTYATGGRYSVRLFVSDGVTSTVTAPLTITVGTPPSSTILSPADGTTFRAGDTISYSGSGNDAEDGALPASAYTWEIDLLHAGHVHPGLPASGSKSGTFTIPTDGHDYSGDVRYRISLTVTDSDGISTTSSVIIWPEKVNVAFHTVPEGLTIYVNGLPSVTPFVHDELIGFNDLVEARDQSLGGTNYAFGSWSDGGAQTHNIVVPAADASYTATFDASTPTPVAAYGFNEGSGSALTDFSGHGLNGTVNGATWTTAGKYGGALSFNGTTSYVDLGNAAPWAMTGSSTWSAWVYATGNPPDDGQIVAKAGNNGAAGWQLKTSPDTGPRTFGVAMAVDGSTNVQRYSTTQPALNTWYHVASVYDAFTQSLHIYVNGVLDDGVLRGTVPAVQFNSPVNAAIGRRTGGFYFQGRIDELRVYNAALTQSQIQADMSTPVGSAPDTQLPTAPTGLAATAISGTRIDLNWTAATDNVGVTGYRVERCQGAGCGDFAEVAQPTGTSYSDTGLSAGITYRYRVRARDAAGNLGAYSSIVTQATPAPDTEAPTAPTGPTATALSASAIDVSWTAATDNVGVTGYRVERCQDAGCSSFVEIAQPTGTSYLDSGLTASTTYRYRVRARDAAGNLGPYSTIVTQTTQAPPPDTQAPTAPAGLTATMVSGSRIDLSWTAATDNVGVTGYRVERCQSAGCSDFAQVAQPAGTGTGYTDTGLTAGTSYTYRVRAVDAAGNLGPFSNTASAATPTPPSGLVAAYSFNEGSGSTAGDSSGSGNPGTLSNATWATGKYGNALNFNGTNARVNVANSSSLQLSSGMTLEAWVNPSTVSSAWRDVVYKGDDNYYLSGTSDRTSRPAGGGTFGSGKANSNAFGSTALTANTWSHLALTYDGGTLRLYVNGTQVGTQNRSGVIASSTNQLQIGGDSIYGQYFRGLIDEVRVYNTALTAPQVQADMNTPIGPGT